MKSLVLYREEQAGDPSSKIRNLAMFSGTCVEEEDITLKSVQVPDELRTNRVVTVELHKFVVTIAIN